MTPHLVLGGEAQVVPISSPVNMPAPASRAIFGGNLPRLDLDLDPEVRSVPPLTGMIFCTSRRRGSAMAGLA